MCTAEELVRLIEDPSVTNEALIEIFLEILTVGYILRGMR